MPTTMKTLTHTHARATRGAAVGVCVWKQLSVCGFITPRRRGVGTTSCTPHHTHDLVFFAVFSAARSLGPVALDPSKREDKCCTLCQCKTLPAMLGSKYG